ncbi:hypothetical protein DMA12_41895 [Amycolatopsis balhimycina DSM 5908]|uniref:Uncharacterized protein n=1 Tax=Amycolatopsis balhimycina DSM 5908 TaxID=1081091 RepID=A0A428VYZ7_AMYBA|nr:hypothetical protein [Amycolatopsis balhimycina]RSM36034.1 hypothetical protein DMA12_41895 [Amycolatopsis balhimycina DSM 5908]
MTGSDRWDEAVLAWEGGSAAISESRNRGWEWRATPAGSNTPELLVGHRTTDAHHDVVRIEMLETPPHAIGARFAFGDWGKREALPLRGPVDGPPEVVLRQVMGWSDDAPH